MTGTVECSCMNLISSLASARNDHIEKAILREHGQHRLPVRRLDECDTAGRKADVIEGHGDDVHQRGVCSNGLRASTEQDGIAGFQTEGGRINGHVRPRFIDDANGPEGYPHFLNPEPVGTPDPFIDVTDGVTQRDDIPDSFHHLPDSLFIEGQTVNEDAGQPVFARAGEILCVGGEDAGGVAPETGIDRS